MPLFSIEVRVAKDLTDDEEFEQGFHSLPHPSARKKMSVEKLAIILSGCAQGKAAYILIEHELNMRLAQEQSSATRWAALYGAVGALAAAGVGAWLTAVPPLKDSQSCVSQWNSSELTPQKNLNVHPPPTIEAKPPVKPIQTAINPAAPIQNSAASQAASNQKR